MDALSELLRVIHLSGTAFIDAELSAPWAVETPKLRISVFFLGGCK
jgi:hypothetical protein